MTTMAMLPGDVVLKAWATTLRDRIRGWLSAPEQLAASAQFRKDETCHITDVLFTD